MSRSDALPPDRCEQRLAVLAVVEADYYQQRAADDPEHITFVDAGRFLRDEDGTYWWRAPCVPGGEPGCDADGTVAVRYVDGLHFCTDPDFAAHGCIGEKFQAGERRASAAIAAQVIPVLAARSRTGTGAGKS